MGLRDMIRGKTTAEKGCREQRFARKMRLLSGKQDCTLKKTCINLCISPKREVVNGLVIYRRACYYYNARGEAKG